MFIDKVISDVQGKRAVSTEPLKPDLYRFDTATPVNDMTDEEIATLAVLCRVRACVSCLADTESSPDISLDKALDDLNQSLYALLQRTTATSGLVHDDSLRSYQRVVVPHGAHLHATFSALEVCKAVATFLETADANSKKSKYLLPKERVMALRKVVVEIYQFLQKDATIIKNSLSKSTVAGDLRRIFAANEEGVEDHIGHEILSFVGSSWAEKFTIDLIESWKDAIDGVLRVKLGLP